MPRSKLITKTQIGVMYSKKYLSTILGCSMAEIHDKIKRVRTHFKIHHSGDIEYYERI